MELYQQYCHRWFELDLRNGIYSQYRYRNRNNTSSTFFSTENKFALGLVPSDLQKFIQIEEIFIVYIYIYIQIISICGAQYKYSGHMVNFFCNVGTIYSQLLCLLEELDVIILCLYNAPIHDRLYRQFRCNFYIQWKIIYIWFSFLKAKHLRYRDVIIDNIVLAGLPFNGTVIDCSLFKKSKISKLTKKLAKTKKIIMLTSRLYLTSLPIYLNWIYYVNIL